MKIAVDNQMKREFIGGGEEAGGYPSLIFEI